MAFSVVVVVSLVRSFVVDAERFIVRFYTATFFVLVFATFSDSQSKYMYVPIPKLHRIHLRQLGNSSPHPEDPKVSSKVPLRLVSAQTLL